MFAPLWRLLAFFLWAASLVAATAVFWVKAGSRTPATRYITALPYPPDTVTVTTDSGGNWLATNVEYTYVWVTVDASDLAAGTYRGTITLTSTAHNESPPARVDVILGVWNEPLPLSAAPASLVFSAPSGQSGDVHTLSVTSNGIPIESTLGFAADDGNQWLKIPAGTGIASYGEVSLQADARNLPPGTYHATLTLTAPPGSTNSIAVPITLNVTPALTPLPQAGFPFGFSILNGASQAVGAVAPGEIVTIFGMSIGPTVPAGLSLDDD